MMQVVEVVMSGTVIVLLCVAVGFRIVDAMWYVPGEYSY